MDVTTTAMIRPELLERTYESFSKGLKGLNFKESTLFLNVDPAPKGRDPNTVVKVAKKFFGEVVVRIPNECNFCKAVQWCFKNARGKYFFHLEDDWILLESVDIQDVINTLDTQNRTARHRKYVSIALRAYRGWSENIALAPSVFYTKFANRVAPLFNTDLNPEEQLRDAFHVGIKIVEHDEYSLRYPHLKMKRKIVRDIGRKWQRVHGITGNTRTGRKLRLFNRWHTLRTKQ